MRDPRLAPFRWPLAAFGLFVLLQAGSGAVLFAAKLGLGADRLAIYYRGSEAAFRAPRSLEGMLEVAVPHLLAIPLVVFVTLHLVGFAALGRRRPLALLSAASFGCALAGILAAFGIRWAWPALAWAKIAAFVGLEATLAAWLVLLAALFVRPREAAAPQERRAAAPLRLRGWAGPGGAGREATPRRERGSAR